MDRLERIQGYIDRTPAQAPAYDMSGQDMTFFARYIKVSAFDCLCLAFDYGRAKGYRQAQAELKATAKLPIA